MREDVAAGPSPANTAAWDGARRAFDSAPVGIVLLDATGIVTTLNAAARELIGALEGAPLARALTEADREAESRARVQLATGEQPAVRDRWTSITGRPLDVALAVLRDEAGGSRGVVVHLEDATQRQHATEQLRRLALHDGLTGLPNRTLFADRLGLALAGSRTESGGVALLFVDLDRFKEVNDTHGHDVGDALLAEVAARISSVLRPGDTAGRLGGDEFVVVCRDVADQGAAEAVLSRLATALQPVFVLGGVRVQPRASIGLVLAAPGDDAETLLRAADTEMYRAKRSRRRPLSGPPATRGPRPSQRPAAVGGGAGAGRLRQRLAAGLAGGELRLAYQPIVNLVTGAPVGVEALVRWQHPDLGLLDPVRFLPAAAETGIVVALDAWVLERACAEAAPMAADSGDGFVVCVNLAGRHLQRPGLFERVDRALRASGLPPQALELDLGGLADVATAGAPVLRDLVELSAAGVRLGMDTADGSLSAARVVPLDAVKLERSLVRGLGGLDEQPADLAVVAAVLTLGRALGLRVGATGVERPEQARRLVELGCLVGQGYLFGRPGPLASVPAEHRSR